MRKPEQSSEPSIEEILASIRKIIADDGNQRAGGFLEAPADVTPSRNEQEPRRQSPRSIDAFYPEPQEPAAAQAEDDILELTEDSMIEGDGGSGDMTFAGATPLASPREPQPAQAGLFAIRSLPPSGEELESVLSNVVAEVQRLSGAPKPSPDIEAAPSQDWAATPPPVPSPSRRPPAAERRNDAAGEKDGATKSAAEASARAAQSQSQSRPAPKPAWSARHLESEGPRVRAPQHSGEKPATRPTSAPRQNMSGPEEWTEGVQMPVPEGGPAAPFLDADESDIAPPLSGSGESRAEIEKEKTFVGEMLTRVFGGSQKKPSEAPPPADPRLAKAEDLAKATIADFASDKLRAPSVAQALHADKPFMDAITDSLATAIAEVEADHQEDMAARDATPMIPEPPELPEALLPPDAESGLFAAPPELSLAPQSAERTTNAFAGDRVPEAPRRDSPFAEPPPQDLPRQHLKGMFSDPGLTERQAHAEIFGTASQPSRQAPPTPAARPAPKQEPAASSKQPAAPLAETASPGIAFPAGLEDSIKDMIKPLIVQWLNDNLPRIVERAVREEIADQDLVSMARGEGSPRH